MGPQAGPEPVPMTSIADGTAVCTPDTVQLLHDQTRANAPLSGLGIN